MPTSDPNSRPADDQPAMQALLSAALADTKAPQGMADRALLAARTAAVIHALPQPKPPAGLVPRTLARLQQPIGQIGTRTGFGLRLGGMAAAAAMAVSLLIPTLAHTQSLAREQACRNNLNMTGRAAACYAQDHQGTLPKALNHLVRSSELAEDLLAGAGDEGEVFLRGASTSQDYLQEKHLVCPCDAHQDASWSYSHNATCMNGQLCDMCHSMPLAADQNPRFERSGNLIKLNTTEVALHAGSHNHKGTGQNVLCADGSAAWWRTPDRQIPGTAGQTENIWKTRPVKWMRSWCHLRT